MTIPTSHRDVVERLGRTALASMPGCSYGRVRQWSDRNRIASDWFIRVSNFAREHGHPEITPELLDDLAPARSREGAAA